MPESKAAADPEKNQRRDIADELGIVRGRLAELDTERAELIERRNALLRRGAELKMSRRTTAMLAGVTPGRVQQIIDAGP